MVSSLHLHGLSAKLVRSVLRNSSYPANYVEKMMNEVCICTATNLFEVTAGAPEDVMHCDTQDSHSFCHHMIWDFEFRIRFCHHAIWKKEEKRKEENDFLNFAFASTATPSGTTRLFHRHLRHPFTQRHTVARFTQRHTDDICSFHCEYHFGWQLS